MLAFFLIVTAIIVTPGQDTVLIVRNTLAGGRFVGIVTALGIAAGQTVWAFAAAFGIVGFVVSFGAFYTALKLAGAFYIVYLGAQSLYAAIRPPTEATDGERPALSAQTGMGQGAISNLSNPKMAVVMVSILPQFTDQSSVAAALGLAWVAMSFLWLTGYACAVERAGNLLRRPRVRRVIEATTGAVLVGMGLYVAIP